MGKNAAEGNRKKGKNCGGDPQKNRQKRVDRVYCRGSYHCDYHGTDGLLQ